MIITSLQKLKNRKILEFNDEVIFTVEKEEIKYEVFSKYLGNSISPNNYIFTKLDLDRDQMAMTYYNYLPQEVFSNDWPECAHGDYAALTRLVTKLYEIIEEKKLEYQPITNRFEILDL